MRVFVLATKLSLLRPASSSAEIGPGDGSAANGAKTIDGPVSPPAMHRSVIGFRRIWSAPLSLVDLETGMWGIHAIAMIAVASLVLFQSSHRVAGEGFWRVECHSDRDSQQRNCEVIGESQRANPDHAVTLIYDVGKERFLGFSHPSPTRVGARVDSHEPIELYLCTGRACLVRGADARRLLQQMRTGSSLIIDFNGAGLSSGVLEMSLGGFEDTYQRALAHLGR